MAPAHVTRENHVNCDGGMGSDVELVTWDAETWPAEKRLQKNAPKHDNTELSNSPINALRAR